MNMVVIFFSIGNVVYFFGNWYGGVFIESFFRNCLNSELVSVREVFLFYSCENYFIGVVILFYMSKKFYDCCLVR